MLDKYILKQGQKVALYLFVLAIFLQIVDLEFLSVLLFFTFILALYVYRVKEVKVDNEAKIVSPVSGTVEAIDFNEQYNFVYLNVSLFDSSILVSPEDSTLKVESIKRGVFLSLDEKSAKSLNEQMSLKTENTTMKLLASFATAQLNKPIEKEYSKGEALEVFTQGELILRLKKECKVALKIGQKVEAGQTVCY